MKLKLKQAAAIVTFTMVLPAAADVIYSNFLNTAIPTDFTGVTINVGSGSLNPFFGGVGVANNSDLQPFRSGTGGLDPLLNFGFGATIDGSNLYLSSGPGGSQTHVGTSFTAGSEGYIGFKLNGANYGWMRVVFTNNTGGAVVEDWAYDNSGSAISVGGIRQVSQDITLSSGFTLSSALANSGGTTNLVKNGSGTNTLSATSTYTGTTTVNAGTLAVSGSLANTSGVTVASTGTLRGSGSINASVTIQNGGTLTAGNTGIESLATGALTLNGGSTFAYKMDNDAASTVAGDLTAVTGGLNFDLGTAAILTLADSGTGSWTAGEKLTLASYTGSWNGGLLKYLGSTIADDSIINFSGIDWIFNYNDTTAGTNFTSDLTGSNFVTMTAVPETRAALLGALGLLMLLRRRRS